MNRNEMLQRLRNAATAWDVVVIGGGASGLFTAVEAAARGLRVALFEQADFAQATSSRSTKLIHGGVRYLEQGRFSLVREALQERGYLLANAPHLVHRRPFILPLYSWWERPFYGTGLKLYDGLAGGLGMGASRHLSAAETRARLPALAHRGLRGGILYYDGQFDDARLAIALAQTVVDLGGVAVNYADVVSLRKQNRRVCGVMVRDREDGREFEVPARVVVNATGIFSDAVRRLDDPTAPPLTTLSQGAHIVLDKSFFPGSDALIIPRTADGRVFFAIPWHEHVLLGTTETPASEAVMEPRPLRTEIDFLLNHAARYLATAPKAGDILSAFAGLRPLARGGNGNTSKISREHQVIVSPSGLVNLIGGKWTTGRNMAEDTINHAAKIGGLTPPPSATKQLRLHGWCEPETCPPHLAVYGADAAALLAAGAGAGSQPLHPRLPCSAAQVVWAARHEMARTVEDVLSRRTRALLLDARAAAEMAPPVARLLARELGRDEAWETRQVLNFRELAGQYLVP
jgi:glycerol-3-phosphate dehydrogenase